MSFKFANSATATIASSITSAATTLTVTTGLGALFPVLTAGQRFSAILTDSSNNIEFVAVTARTGDVLTIARAQEGSVARAFSSGDRIELRLTSAALNNFAQLDLAQTFSGNNTFSGSNTFSGAVTFGGACTFGVDISGKTTNSYLADKASTLANGGGSGSAMTFTWAAFATQPAYFWGSDDGATHKPFAIANMTVPRVKTTNWEVLESGGNLVFKYGGAVKFYITSVGAVVAANDISAFSV